MGKALGEAWWAKVLVCKPENLSSNSQHPLKKLIMTVCACDISSNSKGKQLGSPVKVLVLKE